MIPISGNGQFPDPDTMTPRLQLGDPDAPVYAARSVEYFLQQEKAAAAYQDPISRAETLQTAAVNGSWPYAPVRAASRTLLLS